MNPLQLLIKIIADATGVKAGTAEATQALNGFKAKMDGMLAGLGAGLLQVLGGVAIGKAVGSVIKEADEIYTSLDLLSVKVRNFNPELNETSESLHAFANAVSEGTKFIDDDIVPALDRAIVITGNYGKAQQVVQEAIKLATVANIDLKQAVEYLGLALSGDSRGLMMLTRQLGMSVKEGATMEDVLKKINTAYVGLNEVLEGDLSTQMRKFQDEVSGFFEEIAKPSIKYIIEALHLVGNVVKGIVSVFHLLGGYIGTYFATIYQQALNLAKTIRQLPEIIKTGNFDLLKQAGVEALDIFKRAGAQMGDAWGDVTKIWDTQTKPGLREIRLEAKASRKELEEEEKAEQKAWEKYLAGRRKRFEDEQEKLNQVFADGIALIKQEEKDANWEAQQKIIADYNKVAMAIDGTVRNAIHGMVADLFGAEVSWDEWARNAIQNIVAVIAELLIMKALTGGFGPGGFGGWLGAITGMGGGFSASPGRTGPGTQVQPALNLVVHNLPPGAWVEMQTRMFQDHATPGMKARLARVVATGQKVDVKR